MNDVESYYEVRDLKNNRVLTLEKTQQDAMLWIDDLLSSVKNISFLGILNNIQAECNLRHWGEKQKDEYEIFPDKFKMPLCIINLVLKEHGLKVEYR